MSTIWMDAPTMQINACGLENLLSFIFAHEQPLKEFGAIKIQLSSECLLALKKRKIWPSCTNTQQITKVGDNELIYSVDKGNDINICTQQPLSIPNETTFWSSLASSDCKSQHSSVSILPNKSLFYHKWHRKYFDIHRLPGQSLLKLGGSKVIDQFSPHLTRAHGPGAVFPLASARQRLFLLDYHHQGGARHWYIIPARERETLQKIIQRQNSSICLKHQDLLIDPSVLDKYHIRYHRLVQYPNEFVVLSAGALAQSFMEDAGWNESIAFALPSWIKEGHASAQNLPCQCSINVISLQETIDTHLFTHQLIQKYTVTHLNITIHDDTKSATKVKTVPSRSMTPVVLLHPIQPTFYELLSSLMVSPLSSCGTDEDKKMNDETNSQHQLELCRKKKFENVANQNTNVTTSIKSNSSESFSESSKIQENESYQTGTSVNTQPNPNNASRIDNDISLFDDFMDNILLTPTSSLPCSQIDELLNLYDIDSNQQLNDVPLIQIKSTTENICNQNYPKKRKLNEEMDHHKTLFVSKLKNDVNKIVIYRHFIGCTKVILKQCQTVSNLKYAFVLHSTSEEAARNLIRPIDRIIFGSECHVEYAYDHSHIPIRHRLDDKRAIAVNKIPENVSENDLRHLFSNGYLLKYCPARSIHRVTTMSKTKILWGYAFFLYTDNEQAANVVEHADEYYINGQPLIVSYYDNTKQSHTTTK